MQNVNPELLEYAKQLKENGYRIFFYKSNRNEVIDMLFVKGSKIGYVAKDYYYGWTYSTVNKPSHYQGTGYRVYRNPKDNDDGREMTLTIDMAEKTLASPLLCPWVFGRPNRNEVKAFNSIEEKITGTILEYWEF